LSDTHSSATRDRHISEIVLSKDDPFNTSDNVFGDRFPINTGFDIVTYRLAGMAPNTQLAELDFNCARYFLVFGGLVISQ
jgi:hypothetical protein